MLLMNLLRTPLTVGLSTLTGLVLAAGAPTLEPGPALGAARMAHSTLVQPDGTVLLIGGHGAGFASLATVEHLDPWGVSTGSPRMKVPWITTPARWQAFVKRRISSVVTPFLIRLRMSSLPDS